MTKIIETEVPDWAEWMAQDENGKWYVYEKEPQHSISDSISGGWWKSTNLRALKVGKGDPNPNWREELYKLEDE